MAFEKIKHSRKGGNNAMSGIRCTVTRFNHRLGLLVAIGADVQEDTGLEHGRRCDVLFGTGRDLGWARVVLNDTGPLSFGWLRTKTNNHGKAIRVATTRLPDVAAGEKIGSTPVTHKIRNGHIDFKLPDGFYS